MGIKLKNPLGDDSEYMRLSLAPSLVDAAQQNGGEKQPFFLFEIANVYLPVRGELPEEQMTLSGIFSDYSWGESRGIADGLLEQLGVEYSVTINDARGFSIQQRLEYKLRKEILGSFGKLDGSGLLYFEFDTKSCKKIENR